MRYVALLKDSLVETLDRKSLYVVLGVSVLLILVCASIGFRELNDTEMLNRVVGNFGSLYKPGSPEVQHRSFDSLKFEMQDVTAEGKDHRFTLHVSPLKEFHRAVLTWNAMQKGLVKKRDDPVEGIKDDSVADPGPELEARFLRSQFRLNMVPRAEVESIPGGEDRRSFKVVARSPRVGAMEGGHEITFLFGALSGRLPMSQAVFLLLVEIAVADWIGGFVGVMLAVVFTAGFVPGMLQKGTLDLLLAKPVRRPVILLTKYIGGLFYVAIPATVLIGGCWLAISWRSGYFNYGFLASIGVLIAIFAVLYSFAVLMGVLTRSTIATILLTIALWFLSWVLVQAHGVLTRPQFGINAPGAVSRTIEKVRWILPRTTELAKVSAYYIVMGNLGPELDVLMEGRDPEEFEKPKWGTLVLSSLGFIAVMLGLACWTFSRRDY